MSRTEIFEQIRSAHRLILQRMVSLEANVLRPGARLARGHDASRDAEVHEFIELLKQQFLSHKIVESEVLYPALVAALPQTKATIGPLHAEHAEIRNMVARLETTLEEKPGLARDEQITVQTRDLVDLLRIHLRKEEALVLGVAERVLKPSEIGAMKERMQARSHVESNQRPSPGRTMKGSQE
jgi:hemerythrin-like domain-containing protein